MQSGGSCIGPSHKRRAQDDKRALIVAYTFPKLTDYSDRELAEAVEQFRLALKTESSEIDQEVYDPALTPAVRQDLLKKFRDRGLGRKSRLFGQLNYLWLTTTPPIHNKYLGEFTNHLKQADLP